MTRKVLVTGGAGFIGSHVADAYRAAGDDVTVLDDLSTGKRAHVPTDAAFAHVGLHKRRARRHLPAPARAPLDGYGAVVARRRAAAPLGLPRPGAGRACPARVTV